MYAKTCAFLTCLLILLVLSGCTTLPEPTAPVEPVEQLSYNFTFAPPAQAAEKSGITIGIVAPQWPKDSFSIDEKFRYKEIQPWDGNGPLAPGPIPSKIDAIMKEFSNALQKDYEGMLVARGFNTSGPFRSIQEMTYPEKKACNLVLVPNCQMITLVEQGGADLNAKYNLLGRADQIATANGVNCVGQAVVRFEMELCMYEPLSGEKMWTKRIPLESAAFGYRYYIGASPILDANGNPLGLNLSGVRWDNRAPRFAKALDTFYKQMMDECWKYFSPEEVAVIKTQSDEIRSKKVF